MIEVIKQETSKTYFVWIYIAGDITTIRSVCRKFVLCGLCVTIEPLDFIYTGGCESGARVGLIQYPRFETDEKLILQRAIELGKQLAVENCQCSYSIVDPYTTTYFQIREK